MLKREMGRKATHYITETLLWGTTHRWYGSWQWKQEANELECTWHFTTLKIRWRMPIFPGRRIFNLRCMKFEKKEMCVATVKLYSECGSEHPLIKEATIWRNLVKQWMICKQEQEKNRKQCLGHPVSSTPELVTFLV